MIQNFLSRVILCIIFSSCEENNDRDDDSNSVLGDEYTELNSRRTE